MSNYDKERFKDTAELFAAAFKEYQDDDNILNGKVLYIDFAAKRLKGYVKLDCPLLDHQLKKGA